MQNEEKFKKLKDDFNKDSDILKEKEQLLKEKELEIKKEELYLKKKKLEDLETKKKKLEEIKRKMAAADSIKVSKQHSENSEPHITKDQKNSISNSAEHTKMYHISEKQIDSIVGAVNTNTEHALNAGLHFDNLKQKESIINMLESPTPMIMQGGGMSLNPVFRSVVTDKLIVTNGAKSNANINVASGVIYGNLEEGTSTSISSEGCIAGGYTVDSGIINVDIDANGSTIGGLVEGSGAELKSKAEGGFVQGKAKNSTILAEGTGSWAGGFGLLKDISATGTGSFAHGLASNNDILASGTGSLAHGSASAGDITASATNSVQFGAGTNAEAESLQVGGKIRIKGTAGEPTSNLHNGDIWVDAGDVFIRTGGISVNITDLINPS